MLDQLTLSQLRVLGSLDAGRHDAQGSSRVAVAASIPLELDLALHLDLEEAGRTDDPAFSVDPGLVAEIVASIATDGHWATVESLALAIVRTLLLPPAPGELRARIDAVTLHIRQPGGMRSHAVPGVKLHRTRSWCATERRVLGPGVAADVIAETRSTEIFRVRLRAGAHWNPPSDAHVLVLAAAQVDATTISTHDHPGTLLLVRRR